MKKILSWLLKFFFSVTLNMCFQKEHRFLAKKKKGKTDEMPDFNLQENHVSLLCFSKLKISLLDWDATFSIMKGGRWCCCFDPFIHYMRWWLWISGKTLFNVQLYLNLKRKMWNIWNNQPFPCLSLSQELILSCLLFLANRLYMCRLAKIFFFKHQG